MNEPGVNDFIVVEELFLLLLNRLIDEDMDAIKEDATLNEEDMSHLDFFECSNMSIAPF